MQVVSTGIDKSLHYLQVILKKKLLCEHNEYCVKLLKDITCWICDIETILF